MRPSAFVWLLLLSLYGEVRSIPDLPLRFTAIVEANIIQKNKTYIMEEWYDWPASKAKRVWYGHSNIIQTSYEDFSSGLDRLWIYTTTHQDTGTAESCQLVANSQSSSRSRFDETKSGHLVSSSDWFEFGGNLTETYLGNHFVVRGINAEAWTRNSSYSYTNSYTGETIDTSYSLTYYFNLPSWDWFNSSQSQVPIRVDLSGERVTVHANSTQAPSTYAFHHYYDYVQFMADDLMLDETLTLDLVDWWRQCDISEYCAVYSDVDICQKTPQLPALPQHKYFTIIESTDLMRETTHVMKVWYNYDANELRTEYYADDSIHVTFDQLNEDKRYLWIHPFNATDAITACEVYPYSHSISADSAQFAEEYISSGHLKTVADFWRFSADYNVTYLGNDFTVRNMPAHAYRTTADMRTNRSEIWMDSLFYFADANWSYYEGIETADIPLRVRYSGEYQTALLLNQTHTFDIEYEFVAFFSGDSAFDVQDMEFVFADWYAQCNVTAYCDVYGERSFCHDWRGPPMPSLPEQFSFTIELTHSAWNEKGEDMFTATYLVEEYYDYVNNMAHVIYHDGSSFDNDAVHELSRLDEYQKWIWVGADDDADSIRQCQLTESTDHFTGIDVFVSETNGHIASPQKWFRWNDGTNATTTPIWHGYTTVRGIPAQKWQSKWSEYDVVPSAPMQETYAIQLDTIVTFYWSNASWDIKGSNGWNAPIPISMTLNGVYTLYNQSSASGEYDVFWTTNSFVQDIAIIAFRAGAPNAAYLSIPQQYATECNTTAYCAQYPQNVACIEKVEDTTTTIDDDDNQKPNVTLFVVLMVVLFVLGLIIGAVVDRCVVRRKGQHEFQQVTNVNDADGKL